MISDLNGYDKKNEQCIKFLTGSGKIIAIKLVIKTYY